ncbi:MAG: hypothetical protein ACJAQ6_002495 [Arenicella sp.]|jgi:hypothetical protein
MPIYFNLASHLWIFWLFVFNGLMLTWILRRNSKRFAKLTAPVEARILSAFFLSLAINGLLLLLLDSLSLGFSLAQWPLLLLSMLLTVVTFLWFIKAPRKPVMGTDWGVFRVLLYCFIFIVLFYNGGLIEQISDSWWHMSLANKISLESAFSPELGHLTGSPTRYYPPLWHANLALANKLSGISAPVLWNSFTAWGAVFKVMAFYLLALGLSKDKLLATLAAILFVLLPGVGVSYLRVSAWPSHIAYTIWYSMFYVFVSILDSLPKRELPIWLRVREFLIDTYPLLIVFSVLCVLVNFTHLAELLWFAVAWLSYLILASVNRVLSFKASYIVERDHDFLRAGYKCVLLILVCYSAWFAFRQSNGFEIINDPALAYMLPVVVFFLLLVIDFSHVPKRVSIAILCLLILLLIGSVNYTHLASLFRPALSMPAGQFYESSSVAIGFLGDELKVPNWSNQLRSGLLFSGILSLFVALLLVIIKPTRISLMLAGTTLVAILFCASPYLYHWLQAILAYHSPWRISLIIFHPITWACALVSLVRAFSSKQASEAQING